jgi:protein ImuA
VISVAEPVNRQLPHGGLSAGCIHEVKGASLANAIAFSTVLAARSAGSNGNILCITGQQSIYPLGLLPYAVNLNQLLCVSARRPQERAWAVLEALRCPGVSAVIAMIDGLDLTESRRLQLAAETSGATGFLLSHANSAPVASPITRWRISAGAGGLRQRFDEPVWTVDLLYCRGGRPGSWALQWQKQELIPVAAARIARPYAHPVVPEALIPEAMAG